MTPLWHSWTHTEGAGWLRLSGPLHSLFTVVSAIWMVQSKQPSLQRQLRHSKCDTGMCSLMHTFPVRVTSNRADLLMPLNDDAVILYSCLCFFVLQCVISQICDNQIQRDILKKIMFTCKNKDSIIAQHFGCESHLNYLTLCSSSPDVTLSKCLPSYLLRR